MFTGNKGERSEFYVFLKLLFDKKLPLGDRKLNPIGLPPLQFQKLLRYDGGVRKEYYYSNKDCEIIISEDGGTTNKVEVKGFPKFIQKFFEEILYNSETTFSVVIVEDLIKKLKCCSIKQKAQEKSDLNGIILDDKNGEDIEAGFSIKSSIGGPSTLLNASQHTNFKFKIKGLDEKSINKIYKQYVTLKGTKTSSEIKEVVKAIYEQGGELVFCKGANSDVFENNLLKIDSLMPDIVGEVLKSYYKGPHNKLIDLVPDIKNYPLFIENGLSEETLLLKLKQLSVAIASVIVPNTPWDGFRTDTKGYIIVKDDGNLIGFYIYNEDEFGEYLINNIKLDTPSTSRYGIGAPFFEGNQAFLLLNLQMRFLH